VRILGTIVLPPTALMAVFDPEIAGSSAIRPQVIRDQPIGNEAVFLQKFAHQFQRGVLVSPGLDQHIEDLAFGVDGAPQINHAAIDFQVGFVQMPGRVGASGAVCASLLRSSARNDSPSVEPSHTTPRCLAPPTNLRRRGSSM
jgi:hypothetical protein